MPLSVRKEMLERELNKLGFHKAGQGGSSHPGAAAQQQQQPQDDRPQADEGPNIHSE